jgi:hypothetical protein
MSDTVEHIYETSYYKYIEQNTDNCIYVVTRYGCNSTPSDLWTPKSMIFNDFKEAHKYFLEIAPNINDTWNYAEQYIREFNISELKQKHFIIESRCQTAGYHSGRTVEYTDDGKEIYFAKRPFGAVLARCLL